jgi:hypothetical protein
LEWEPDERDAWVGDAERWIEKIKGVRNCKIELDGDGAIVGIHVVTGTDREPRHIVRDVEGLLKARLDLDVYYKKIGVVQVVESDDGLLDDEEPDDRPDEQAAGFSEGLPRKGAGDDASAGEDDPGGETAAPGVEELAAGLDDPVTPAVLLAEELAPRLQCAGVAVMASDLAVRAEVDLVAGGAEAQGVEEGANHSESDIGLVGRASVAAIRALIDEPVVIELAEIRLDYIGGQEVVIAAVELVEGRRSERLFGTCPTSHNRHQAVVYAVLDAMNRRLALMTLKLGEAIG